MKSPAGKGKIQLANDMFFKNFTNEKTLRLFRSGSDLLAILLFGDELKEFQDVRFVLEGSLDSISV